MLNVRSFEQINSVCSKFNAQLVAVSKTQSISKIEHAYDLGQRVFGENKVQELTEKYEVLPKDIEWHMIGHLQSNKVKYIASFVKLIHSVDSLKLLAEINKRAAQHDRVIECLLQFHIAEESSKFGFDLQEAKQLLNHSEFKSMQHVSIVGVMGMATFSEDKVKIRNEFRKLKHIFEKLKLEFYPNKSTFNEISMGMSGDYEIALEEGSTLVRVGSKLFGNRLV